jgi:hypothetical protein
MIINALGDFVVAIHGDEQNTDKGKVILYDA